MFKAVCPHCSQQYTLDNALLGKTASCKRCRKVFTLEEDNSTSVAPTPQRQSGDDSGFDLRPPTGKDVREIRPPSIAEMKAVKRFPPESGMWNVGDVVLGTYEVKPLSDELPYAEGGVGIVNRVYHREWDMDLAVKSPKPHVFQTEGGKQSYEKEAQTWIELGLHPNIVTCYLVRRISNIPRLFAEFVPDGSLRDWLTDGRLYDGGPEAALLRILNVATQFAWGLEHAHRQKLLHLDVKPANVMMAGQTAKVTDFGLAQGVVDNLDSKKWSKKEQNKQAADSSAVLNSIAAGGMTPGYCSPEQYLAFRLAQQQEFDKMPKITLQSDIWSWGVSLLAMFHGRAPCKKGGQTARKVFEIFLKAEPDGNRPKMPKPIAELLFHCFEEEPKKRPESMEWIADELTRIYKEISGVDFPRPRPISATWTPESINNRAASMLDLDKPDEAVKLLDQAAALQPWQPEVTYNQTLLAWRSSRITDMEAIERLETLVKTRPLASGAQYALGLAHRERGNPQSAVDAYENAWELENREDVRRAMVAAEKIVGRSARCLDRIQLAPGMENEILVDDAGNYVITAKTSQIFELRETSTGRVQNTFKPPAEEQRRTHPSRIALSDDLLLEVVLGQETGTVLLRRVGNPQAMACLRPVGWQRYFGRQPGEPAPSVITRPEVPWSAEIKDGFIDVFNKRLKKKIGDLFGHEDTITALCFSVDGRFALSGSADKTVRLWEIPSCRCLRTFTSVGGAVDAVYFGRNNQYALSLIAGGSLRIWDISVLCGSKTAFRAPFLLSHVASAEEVGRQQSEMNRHCEEIRNVVKNADFAAAIREIEKAKELTGWEAARRSLDAEGLWDIMTRHTARKSLQDALNTRTFIGHHDIVSTIAMSLDGNTVASAGRDQSIRIWNISEQKCTVELEGHADWVRSIEMTMDAKFLVSGSWDMSVRVWNLSSGQCVRKFEEKVKSLTKIALNPQGRLVAIGNGSGAVVLWDVLTDNIMGRFLAHSGSVNTVRFNRNGQYFVTGGDDNKVCVWKLGRDEPVRTITVHKTPVTGALISADLTRVISSDRDGRIVVWSLRNNRMEFDVQGHFGDVTGLELLTDGRFFLSSAKDMKVRLEGIENRAAQRIIEGHPSLIHALALDVSGRRFVTGCEDAVVRVWDLYWDHEFSGWSELTLRAETTLRMLLSLYSPSFDGREKPVVDETILKRITLEMEYRGFGMILPEQLRQAIQRILADWHGPDEITPE